MPWSDVLGFALLAAVLGYGALKVLRADRAKDPDRVRLSGISLLLGSTGLTIHALADGRHFWARLLAFGLLLAGAVLDPRPRETFDAISRRGKRSE